MLSALGLRENGLVAREKTPAEDPTTLLIDHCAHRGLLLVLDNCEHVIGAAADLADRLLAHCPGIRVLATSREPLGVPGEVLRPVEPLPPDPAHRLFADRAAAAGPGSPRTTTRRPSPRSAPASTAFRSPSNSPPPGCGCSPRARSPTGSTTGSGS